MDISKALKRYRNDAHITQTQLAKKLHISRKTISNWENGRSEPSFDTLLRLSDIYKVSVDNILRNNEIESHKKIINYQKKLIGHKQTYLKAFINAWKLFIKGIFCAMGCSKRFDYNCIVGPFLLISVIIMPLLAILAVINYFNNLGIVIFLCDFCFVIAFYVFGFCLIARRGHDIGINKWFALLMFIPQIGLFYIFALMLIPTHAFYNLRIK